MISELNQITDDLERIRRVGIKDGIFGADVHEFKMRPPLTEMRVREFEGIHAISLPAEYRRFLISVGDGGAGPYHGVFPLGQTDQGWGLAAWYENDGFVGKLSKPFPLTAPWNDLTGEPSESNVDEERYERQLEEFEARYWDPALVNGAIPISHRGCALRAWLIVTGTEAGNIWHDDRADRSGLYPVKAETKERVTFFAWYRAWLDDVLVSLE